MGVFALILTFSLASATWLTDYVAQRFYDVVVLGFRLRGRTVPLGLLDEMFGIGPDRARELTTSYPCVVLERTSLGHAERAAARLRDEGARVEVVESDKRAALGPGPGDSASDLQIVTDAPAYGEVRDGFATFDPPTSRHQILSLEPGPFPNAPVELEAIEEKRPDVQPPQDESWLELSSSSPPRRRVR